MPTVATKTLNRLNMGGRMFTKTPEPVSYEEALALQDDHRLSVMISQDEHADYHAGRAAAAAEPEEKTGEEEPEAPKDPKARQDAIILAAAELDPDDESHYTNAGLPDARALSRVLGWTVTAAERNVAFGAKENDPTPEESEKPKGKINIRKRSEEPAEPEVDPSTKGGVEV